MDIVMNRDNLPSLSPFGRKVIPLSIEQPDGSERIIDRGTSLPDLIRIIYKSRDVHPLHAHFGFLERDNKVRKYEPYTEDKFVFSRSMNIEAFKKDAMSMIDFLNQEWTNLGLPLKDDKIRRIKVPDSSIVMESLDSKHKHHNHVMKHWNDITFILSNIDIAKKACVVRCVIPGWWTASYSGRDAKDITYFNSAFRVFKKMVHIIVNTDRFRSVLAETRDTMGDPLDTGVGYPFYTGAVDPSGNPITKLACLKLYEGIGTRGFKWRSVLEEVDRRCPVPSLKGFPFAIAPIRRSQYGYKPAPCFSHRSTGLVTSHSEYGSNTTRIAWMASYPLNLYMSPFQAVMKSIRKLIPGMYHEGSTVAERMKWMDDSVYTAEADYTNYDRFMPIDVVKKIIGIIASNYKHSDYWLDVVSYLHEGIPMIWPDYIPGYSNRGYVFTPERIGLLSGVKITSDIGSFVNLIVTLESCLRSGLFTEQSALAYLTSYSSSVKPGSRMEYFLIQSDDLLLMHKNPSTLKKMGEAFKQSADAAGLKSSFELGDRFLMRHTRSGRDLPVPMRVWQNTLSNEEPYSDAIKFTVGVAMRTDGLLGYKTINPFTNKNSHSMTRIEVKFTLLMLNSLHRFLSGSSHPVNESISIVSLLIQAASQMLKGEGDNLSMDPLFAGRLDIMRKASLEALANAEMSKLQGSLGNRNNIDALIYSLHKDSNIPSQKLLLDQILSVNSNLKVLVDRIEKKESSFYKYALNQLGLTIEDV